MKDLRDDIYRKTHIHNLVVYTNEMNVVCRRSFYIIILSNYVTIVADQIFSIL